MQTVTTIGLAKRTFVPKWKRVGTSRKRSTRTTKSARDSSALIRPRDGRIMAAIV
jgi:hypothetical protein